MIYDSIIIGAGVSGLYMAYKLSEKGKKVLIIERNNYLGGRIYTHKDKLAGINFQYEAGAARIASIHILILKLITEFDLDNELIEISNERIPIVRNLTYNTRHELDTVYNANDNEKLDIQFLINKVLKKSNLFSEQFLRTISIFNLAQHILSGPASQFLLDAFGYDGELLHLNAYDGIRMFKNSFSFKNKYFILKSGLSNLCNMIGKRIEDNGGLICLNRDFKGVSLCSLNL